MKQSDRLCWNHLLQHLGDGFQPLVQPDGNLLPLVHQNRHFFSKARHGGFGTFLQDRGAESGHEHTNDHVAIRTLSDLNEEKLPHLLVSSRDKQVHYLVPVWSKPAAHHLEPSGMVSPTRGAP